MATKAQSLVALGPNTARESLFIGHRLEPFRSASQQFRFGFGEGLSERLIRMGSTLRLGNQLGNLEHNAAVLADAVLHKEGWLLQWTIGEDPSRRTYSVKLDPLFYLERQ